MRVALLIFLSYLIVGSALAETLSGPFKVIDAATLDIDGQRVRLIGIAAPSPSDKCTLRNATIPCGRVATSALLDLTAGAKVSCRIDEKRDPDRTIMATCKANGYDLSEGMIYTGWARPNAQATAHYRKVEVNARERRRGLWRGEFPDNVNKAAVSR